MKLFVLWLAIVLVVAENESPALKELTSGNLKFSANTYKELAKENAGKNFLACPLSVQVILALVEAGANGTTAQELIKGLNLPQTEVAIHNAFKAIAPYLNVDNKYTLTSANKIYLKKDFKIRQEFKNVATQVFKAEISHIDFNKTASAVSEINKWVADKTRNKIKDLITPDDLDELTRAVLVNALYFHGYWVKEFDESFTAEKSFKINSKNETKVKMMEQTDKFYYYEDDGLKAKFLQMFYLGGSVSAIFVLPNDVDGLSALESNIDKVLEPHKFNFEKVHVQIPQIKIEQKIDFIPILTKFGVQAAFSQAADFSRLNENNETLSISKVIQKTFIAVEEKGTTAAAATAAVFNRYSAIFDSRQPIKEFEANHPFILILKSQNFIMFVGRYADPGNTNN